MRCLFMRNGRIAAVEHLDVASDEEAIERTKLLFAECKDQFEGFDVSDNARNVAFIPQKQMTNMRADNYLPSLQRQKPLTTLQSTCPKHEPATVRKGADSCPPKVGREGRDSARSRHLD
jgi:hypothetical protein